uniref:Uncharacterized protein n=1 Tax=Oryza rufipogon TaxID=4529 RepID=A0A0E0RJN4_ORYRU
MAADLAFEATELRLGLPGGGGDGDAAAAAARSSSGKRGFAETIDLKLKLEPAAAAHRGQWRNARTEAEKEEHLCLIPVSYSLAVLISKSVPFLISESHFGVVVSFCSVAVIKFLSVSSCLIHKKEAKNMYQ